MSGMALASMLLSFSWCISVLLINSLQWWKCFTGREWSSKIQFHSWRQPTESPSQMQALVRIILGRQFSRRSGPQQQEQHLSIQRKTCVQTNTPVRVLKAVKPKQLDLVFLQTSWRPTTRKPNIRVPRSAGEEHLLSQRSFLWKVKIPGKSV